MKEFSKEFSMMYPAKYWYWTISKVQIVKNALDLRKLILTQASQLSADKKKRLEQIVEFEPFIKALRNEY